MDPSALPLAPYIEGTFDSRSFLVDGCTLYVGRGPTYREAGFHGTGRDGDVVLPGSPDAAAFARVIEGIPGLARGASTSCTAQDEATLAQVERALLAASGGYLTIGRQGRQVDPAVALQLFRTPRLTGRRRAVTVRGGLEVTVELKPGPSGSSAPETVTAIAWAVGRPVGDLVETTLTRLGASPERSGGSATNPQFAIPPALALPFLDALLAAIGTNDVHVSDG